MRGWSEGMAARARSGELSEGEDGGSGDEGSTRRRLLGWAEGGVLP